MESSKEREPLAILAGHGNIIPGLEKAMEGHEAGDKFGVDVAAAGSAGAMLPHGRDAGAAVRTRSPPPQPATSIANAAPAAIRR